MAQVFLGLGSNIDAHRQITQGLNALNAQFGTLQLSPVYESEAMGFVGDNFLNLVVGITTHLGINALLDALRKIENDSGRNRDAPRFSGRTLDIDILTYDNLHGLVDGVHLPRDEVFKNAFVLKPFSELAPQLMVPGTQTTLQQLWHSFDASSQRLWKIKFQWQPQATTKK